MVISHKPLKLIIAILIAFLPTFGFSNTPIETAQSTPEKAVVAHETEAKPTDEKSEVKAKILEVIGHHVLDGHDFSLFEYEGEHIGFSLPIILWDNGVHFFSSSKFNHGETVAESNGNFYVLHHEKIYKTDASGTLTGDEHHPTNLQPIDLSITKGVLTIMIVALLMFFIFTSLARSYAKNGGISSGFGRLFEPIVIYIRDEIAIPNIGEKHYNKYMGFLLSVFFFVWIVNLIGLTPLGINVTGNIAITVALSLMTLFITLYTSKSTYWAHIFWMPGVPVPMKILLAPIELLGVIIKPFALLIRLYANIKAGHIVLMSLIAVMYLFDNWGAKGAFLGLSFFLNLIELLVAFLQAYIFTMLSALYFGAASEEHHHEEAHH